MYTLSNVNENIVVEISANTVVDEAILAENWISSNTLQKQDDLTLGADPSLKAEYLKQLWDAGYTHLVFTANAPTGGNYIHGGTWDRYWGTLEANADTDVRIDLSEFCVDNTWYDLCFINMTGDMTVSNPRAYKSAETLDWQKSTTNCYFALENGYYVLETHANDSYVTSPTQWLKKYVVADEVSQRSWLMYTDYITKGTNTRSMVWGWGSPVNVINDDVNGGWSWNNGVQTDGYTDGEVFSLHLDHNGTARFKLLDWVSNRNSWNVGMSVSYVDEQSIRWSAIADQKLRLATTQDLIAEGYTTLKVTLTGELGNALIWYGEDDWSDGETAISSDHFTDGSYTFEVDLTTFTADENFTMLASEASFKDMLVHIQPVRKTAYTVSLPTGLGYRVQGGTAVYQGGSYSFTLSLDAGYTKSNVLVKVNGVPVDGTDGIYTVENVQENLTVTVENVSLNTYTVTKTAGEGFTVSGADTVTHGVSYTFRVTPDDPNAQFVVLVNGSAVTGSGYGYFCHKNVYKQSTVHAKAIDAANAAITAIAADSSLSEAEKATYTKRANALLATVYGSVIGNWSGYEKWHDEFLGSDTFADFEAYFGATVAECQEKLTSALENAGITKASESDMSIDEWITFITDLHNTAG